MRPMRAVIRIELELPGEEPCDDAGPTRHSAERLAREECDERDADLHERSRHREELGGKHEQEGRRCKEREPRDEVEDGLHASRCLPQPRRTLNGDS
jgi:hypothetical protein